MAEYNKVSTEKITGKKRWEKILEYPDSQVFWDIVTSNEYRRGQFEPAYDDRYQTIVNHFKIKGTTDLVPVNFLRLQGDYMKCSIMKRGEV